jgi:hypothetical protein
VFILFHFCGRRFAAEVWDAKGRAIPTLGYEDAALRLKNGACETMPLPICAKRASVDSRVGAPSLTHLCGNAAIAFSRNAALQLKFGTPRAW